MSKVPDDAHAEIALWSVETETKPVLAVQVRQYKGEVFLTLTVCVCVCVNSAYVCTYVLYVSTTYTQVMIV